MDIYFLSIINIHRMDYDIIIVGAGIAGLRIGIELIKMYPSLSCCILEKYNYTGGRVFTFRSTLPHIGAIQWENGAGRISTTHHKVLSLLKKYDLSTYPISSDATYCDTQEMPNDPFARLHDIFLKPLQQLPPHTLQTHTVGELLEKIVGAHTAKQYYQTFPYWSEIHSLRADAALLAFGAEMGSMNGFVGCVEGLSSLTTAMKKEFLRRGGHIQYNMEVRAISPIDKGVKIQCKKQLFARICILALHRNAVATIRGVQHIPVLSKLIMEPLLRMYAVFPVRNKTCWFSELSKTITNGRIRFFIPIDPKKGVVMISYTDGADARYWMKKSPAIVQRMVMTEIRQLFSDRIIPDPLYFTLQPWKDGCTYWRPGRYNIHEESKKSLQPLPNTIPSLFLCGESFAVQTCWIESALNQADQLFHLPAFQSALKALK